MRKVFIITAIISIFVISNCVNTIASEITQEQLLKEIEYLKSRISVLEKKVTAVEKKEKDMPSEDAIAAKVERRVEKHVLGKLEEDIKRKAEINALGLSAGISATMIVQGALEANRGTDNKEDATDGSYQVDIQFVKKLGDYGYAFTQIEAGDGVSVMDDLEVFSNVNNNNDDTDNHVDLTKFWYEHNLFDKQFSFAVGKWDPTDIVDCNLLAGDDSRQFLAEIFNNAPTFDRPSKAPGVWGRIRPKDLQWIELQAQAFTGDGGWENVIDHLEFTPEINIKPKIGEGLVGNYRFYGWLKRTNYTQWSDSTKTAEHRYGFGTSIDQQITDIFGVFGRYGWADPDLYDPDITSLSGTNFSIEHTWSAGMQLDGKIWGREDDHIAVACGMVMPSDKYKEYAGTNLKADEEGHAELYYYWKWNKHFAFSPDLQVIWNPFGNDYVVNGQRRDQTITVIGCRGHLDF
jgi:hypothetical protein